jgi:hypothetical protein
MDAVLHMPPPEEHWTIKPEDKPPHLTPPPYVHHFDSYSLVKQLEGGGYTQAQAITAMKAVRALLAQNLDVAQGGLVSKSDVENETYLFKAACAELSTEVMNNRRVADESLRQQRTILQHEVDNTSQALNQELLTLNDNVKGMFNDRKMAVREEQKAAESAVGFPPLSPSQARLHLASGLNSLTPLKGPTNSLQDQRYAEQRLQVPDRGRAMGPRPSRRHRPVFHGDGDADRAAVQQSRFTGAKEGGKEGEGRGRGAQEKRRQQRRRAGARRGGDFGSKLGRQAGNIEGMRYPDIAIDLSRRRLLILVA